MTYRAHVSTYKYWIDDQFQSHEIYYSFSAKADTVEEAMAQAVNYASMIEYGTVASTWGPEEMAFPEMQLTQFIQPATLDNLKMMCPEVVQMAYKSAKAYVSSYFGNMFNIDAMLGDNSDTLAKQTLSLALCIATASYILASSPQYSETMEQHNKQLHALLRGLKSGQRNMGKGGIPAEPNVRVGVVNLMGPKGKP